MTFAGAPFVAGAFLAADGGDGFPAAYADGTASAAMPANGRAAQWRAVVSLGGGDVSDRVVGEIVVEAEEGAARIAEFTLRPVAGEVLALPAWTGRAVTIDLAEASTGIPRWPMRLFTGVVDTPAYQPADRTVSVRATDDLQGALDALSNAQIAALVGGRWSPAVFEAAARGWQLAQDRLSTVAGCLDLSPVGVLRVTPWEAASTPHLSFDAAWVGDQSLAVDLADRQGLVNTVEVDFRYRFPRLKAEGHALTYTYVDLINFAQYVLDGKWFLQRSQVESAISSAGGTVIGEVTYTAMPSTPIAVGAGFWTPSAADASLCMGFTAVIAYDYAQQIEEQHAVTVSCAGSVAQVGAVRQSLSGALEGRYQEAESWETKAKLYRAEVEKTAPQDLPTVVSGKTNGLDPSLTPDSDRAAATAAIETLIDVAKTKIWAAHRRNSVGATICLNPVVDLDKTIAISADGVLAQGKCRRVVHRMDPAAGAATTELTLAICAVSGVGVNHPETVTAAAPAPAAGQTNLPSAPAVTFNNGAAEDHEFSITFPAVLSAERDPAAPVISSAFAARIVEDVFTVTP